MTREERLEQSRFVALVARGVCVRKASGTWPVQRDAIQTSTEIAKLTEAMCRAYAAIWSELEGATDICQRCGHEKREHLDAKICLDARGYFKIHPRQTFAAGARSEAA